MAAAAASSLKERLAYYYFIERVYYAYIDGQTRFVSYPILRFSRSIDCKKAGKESFLVMQLMLLQSLRYWRDGNSLVQTGTLT